MSSVMGVFMWTEKNIIYRVVCSIDCRLYYWIFLPRAYIRSHIGNYLGDIHTSLLNLTMPLARPFGNPTIVKD